MTTTAATPTRIAIDFSTDIDFVTETPRICPTCAAVMDEVRPHVYVCPVQRTEARGVISDELRQRGRELTAGRALGCDF